MKKDRIIPVMFLCLMALAGCKKAELPDYALSEEGINFYSDEERIAGIGLNNYPELLNQTYQINTWPNNRDNVAEVTVDFSVSTQGMAREVERKAYIKAREVIGWQVDLPITEYVFAPGEGGKQVIKKIPYQHVPRGRMTTWVIEFDYEKGDFIPGMEERQLRTVTVDNRYTYSSVGLDEDYWIYYIAGSAAGGQPGLGPWSNMKAMFMAETLGTTDFEDAVLYPIAVFDDLDSVREPLREALEEYKAHWAADPDKYPPLLDDAKNDGSWITFQEE